MEMMTKAMIPPQDIDVEKAVLGLCLLREEALVVAVDSLTPESFYNDGHAEIFRVILSLYSESQPVDVVTVVGKLGDSDKLDRVGGPAYLAELSGAVPVGSRVEAYCERLNDKMVLRRLITHSNNVVTRCYDNQPASEVSDFAESGLFDVAYDKSLESEHIGKLAEDALELMRERAEAGGDVIGVPTGFVDLDRKLAGMHGGDLIIIAGRPSMGKTAFAMNIVQNAALGSDVSALVFSMEMSGKQLAERVVAGVSGVGGQGIRTGVLSDKDWPKLEGAVATLAGAKIHIDSQSNLSIVDVRARTRRMYSKYNIGLVVIDYLQLMRGVTKGDRVQEVAEISRGLKALARDLDIPVVALCQLNRSLESRPDKRPMMSDLRESGSLEQDADVVMFVYRDEYYHPGRDNANKAELIIAKQRCGDVGMVPLVFHKSISTFRSAAYGN